SGPKGRGFNSLRSDHLFRVKNLENANVFGVFCFYRPRGRFSGNPLKLGEKQGVLQKQLPKHTNTIRYQGLLFLALQNLD
ncbi:MAG: hypothetical protein PHX41_02735, partial [Kiritimatiellae bacterium]|nr:hypothetical protein [Kiritimatiellia bacterium]